MGAFLKEENAQDSHFSVEGSKGIFPSFTIEINGKTEFFLMQN